MRRSLPLLFALFALAAAIQSHAVDISVADYSLVPNGLDEATTFQNTDVGTLNGGQVLPTGTAKTVYVVSTFSFGATSDAHLQWQFSTSSTTGNRIGVEVQDTGLVQSIGTGAGTITVGGTSLPNRTSVNLAQDMAGKTVVLLAKLSYDANHSVTYGRTSNTSDDTLMNVWINPDNSDVEGSGLTAGDLYALWNSAGFSHFRQTIQNKLTPPNAGTSSITQTKILTGADATWANALALATGGTTPGDVDAGISTVSASPTAVPADGTSTSTITVTLKDAGGIPVAGKQVSLAGNGSATISTGNNTSNASGMVAFIVKSSAVGVEDFTATVVAAPDVVITQKATVDFQTPVVVGPVHPGNSSVSASPSSVFANGIATSTITVILRDSNGLLISGEGVTLVGSPVGATITPSTTQITNGSGQAVFTAKSSVIGPVLFSATSVTDSIAITETANVNFTDPQLAQSFNVNFRDDGQANATGLLGVVGEAGETWNQGTGHDTGAISNLVDTTGTMVSTVAVSGTGDDGRPISGTGLSLFNANRGFFGKGQDTTLSINGHTPNTAYDLYLYALSHATASWGDLTSTERAAGDFTTANTVLGNGQSQWLDNAVPGTNGNSFVPNGNYVVFQSVVSTGSGNISIVVDAYDGSDGNPATSDGDCRLHVCGLQIRPASGMNVDYMNWRTTRYPGVGLPGADDDGDGLSNDFERIFGLSPKSAASANPYPLPFARETGHFSYSRRAKSQSNLDYKVWYSTNLQNWFEDNAAVQTVTSTAGDVETVGVHIDPVLLGHPKLFLQVRAGPINGVNPEPSLVNLWGNGNTITLLFSEPMNPASAGNPANYSVTREGGVPVNVTGATLSSDGGSVTLTLASAVNLKTNYTVGIERVTSSTGQSLGTGVSRQFRTWDDDPSGIKVFILGGQSNMVGYGYVESGATGPGTIGSLRYMAINDATYTDYNYASLLTDPGQPATSPFRTRADVKVWWRDPGNQGTLGGAIRKGDLGPPYQGGPTDGSRIGPEYAFGQVIGDFYTADDVLIIKTAWGGRDLVKDFRPPSAVARVPGTQVGVFYNAIIEQSREVLNNLGTQFPEWSGRGYQIVGFAWHQGYNDRISTSASTEYKNNLPDLITDIRTVFNKPNLPVAIASTGMAIGAPGPFGSYSAVEQAQLWVAGVGQPAHVLSTDTRPFWRAASVSPVDQGHHWNHNAESYFLIGKSLGDNMVDLLTP